MAAYTIRFAVVESPMIHADFTALYFVDRELLPIEGLHCGNKHFRLFLAPVTLTSTRWPSYTN